MLPIISQGPQSGSQTKQFSPKAASQTPLPQRSCSVSAYVVKVLTFASSVFSTMSSLADTSVQSTLQIRVV